MKKAVPVLVFDSISSLLQELELPAPRHPLIAVVNYETENISLADAGKIFLLKFYKIAFKGTFKGQVRYGQGYYDFHEGGMAFLGPDQMVTMSTDKNENQGYALYFHPDLIRNYPLGNLMDDYGFFSYHVSEALFLSASERKVITALFETIIAELENNIDQYSQDVLVSQISLLLNHCNRFYNRQFLTRKMINHNLIELMNDYLKDWFDSENPLIMGLPSPTQLADHLNVSPRYLSDMLKSQTGQTSQQHIHNKLIEQAKKVLSTSALRISEVAYQLGFEHPQSFNKLFKQKTNQSPLEYRQLFYD
jgi:AraC-like DNA-binding protein